MLHRHLTLERFELALEEQPFEAASLRARARSCPGCATALGEPRLAVVLARWKLPETIDRPADWQAALRRAIAPASQRSRVRRFHRWRLTAAAALLVGLLLTTALPASASAGPDSTLFPVRGWQEDARWDLTPEPDRAQLDADLASAYLWQARVSAGRHDGVGYEASMRRFFEWGTHLKKDVRQAPPAERSRVRASIAAARSLVPGLAASAPDAAEARRAGSVLDEVEGASEQGSGQLQENAGPGSVSKGEGQPGSAASDGASQTGGQEGNTSGGSGPGGAQGGS